MVVANVPAKIHASLTFYRIPSTPSCILLLTMTSIHCRRIRDRASSRPGRVVLRASEFKLPISIRSYTFHIADRRKVEKSEMRRGKAFLQSLYAVQDAMCWLP